MSSFIFHDLRYFLEKKIFIRYRKIVFINDYYFIRNFNRKKGKIVKNVYFVFGLSFSFHAGNRRKWKRLEVLNFKCRKR